MSRRTLTLPTVEPDRVGEKVTLVVEAWVTRIEAELVDVSMPGSPEDALPGEQWTTFQLGRATRDRRRQP